MCSACRVHALCAPCACRVHVHVHVYVHLDDPALLELAAREVHLRVHVVVGALVHEPHLLDARLLVHGPLRRLLTCAAAALTPGTAATRRSLFDRFGSAGQRGDQPPNGRLGAGLHLEEQQATGCRLIARLLRWHHAQHLALVADQPQGGELQHAGVLASSCAHGFLFWLRCHHRLPLGAGGHQAHGGDKRRRMHKRRCAPSNRAQPYAQHRADLRDGGH